MVGGEIEQDPAAGVARPFPLRHAIGPDRLAEGGLDRAHRAEPPRAHQRRRVPVKGMGAKVEPDRADHVRLPDRVQDPARLGDVEGERFLDVDVLPGARGGHRQGRMRGRGGGDDDRVDVGAGERVFRSLVHRD